MAANAGDAENAGSIPGLGRSLGGGSGNPLQYSCLENSLDRGAWWATVSGIAESDMTEHARTHTSVTLPQQLGIGLLGLTGCSLLAVFSNHEELSDDLAF